MKSLLFLLSLTFSTQAFCIHNYFDETCSFNSKKGEIFLYKREYWDGYHSVLNSDIPGLDDYPEVFLPGKEGTGDDKVTGDEAIIFSDVVDTNEKKEPYDDGCWKGFNATLDRKVKIEKIKSNVQNILEINSGDELTMKCSYEHLVVLGDACSYL